MIRILPNMVWLAYGLTNAENGVYTIATYFGTSSVNPLRYVVLG